ncbi:MAG: esterase/lipase family protein [Sciscionella sp.]
MTSLAFAAVRLPAALDRRQPCLTEVPLRVSPPSWTCQTPVLLLHGYLGTEAAWTPLAERLHAAGFRHVYTFGYDSLSVGVPELAASLVDAAHMIAAQTGQPAVHVVGHSLGGVIARYAVQQLRLHVLTPTVVMIATPYRGVGLARLGPGPAAAQLRSTSTLLRQLPPLAQTPAVRWAAIYGSADFVVPPPPTGHDLSLSGYGHHSILHSTELATTVITHLTAPHNPRATQQCDTINSLAA